MNRLNYVLSAVGGYIVILLGGVDDQLTALIVLMALDFLSGFLCACIGKSTKSENGFLSSRAAGAGVVKKAAYLICVIVDVLLEQVTRLSFVREVVIISFVITETLSVLENCKALGIRIPPAIYNAIDLLKAKKAPGEGSVSPSGDPEKDPEEEDPSACG